MNPKFTRARFAAAVALFTLWLGALVTLAVVSGTRPADRTAQAAPAPAFSSPEPEPR